MGFCGMDVDLLKAIWNGMKWIWIHNVDPHVDFVAWIGTLPAYLSDKSELSSPLLLPPYPESSFSKAWRRAVFSEPEPLPTVMKYG